MSVFSLFGARHLTTLAFAAVVWAIAIPSARADQAASGDEENTYSGRPGSYWSGALKSEDAWLRASGSFTWALVEALGDRPTSTAKGW
jgi:hypothetical protein